MASVIGVTPVSRLGYEVIQICLRERKGRSPAGLKEVNAVLPGGCGKLTIQLRHVGASRAASDPWLIFGKKRLRMGNIMWHWLHIDLVEFGEGVNEGDYCWIKAFQPTLWHYPGRSQYIGNYKCLMNTIYCTLPFLDRFNKDTIGIIIMLSTDHHTEVTVVRGKKSALYSYQTFLWMFLSLSAPLKPASPSITAFSAALTSTAFSPCSDILHIGTTGSGGV